MYIIPCIKGKKQYVVLHKGRAQLEMRTHGWLNSSNPLVHRDGDAGARQVDSHVADCEVK